MKICQIPFDMGGLGKTLGCRHTPNILIDFLKNIDFNESRKKINFETCAAKIITNDIEGSNKNIYELVKKEKPDIILGGDHSITYQTFKASDCDGLVILDAHPDMVNNFKPPTHEDYLKVLIEDGLIDPKKVILIGIRNTSEIEYRYLKDKKILYFDMKRIVEDGFPEVVDTVMELVRKFQKPYISLDIDVVDPAFAPGTGYPEPGGLSSRELIYFIKRLGFIKSKKIYDLVEINPDKDLNDITLKLGAKIISEIF